MPYIPLGYANAFALQSSMEEVHGGSPYGAGTFANVDGSRQPSTLELEIAEKQGEAFVKSATKLVKGSKKPIPPLLLSQLLPVMLLEQPLVPLPVLVLLPELPLLKNPPKKLLLVPKRKLPMAPLLELNNLQKP